METPVPLYSLDILSKSIDDRVAYFRNEVKIEHPLLAEVRDELKWAIFDSSPGSIILFFGPTGAGKTTVLDLVEEDLIKYLMADLERDLGRFPAVRIHIKNPSSHNFDWKDYFKQLLKIMCEPLLDGKDDAHRWEILHKEYRELTANYRSSGSKYRDALEGALTHRKPIAVLVDDAQHFGVVGPGRKVLDQLNTVKSVADQTKVTHVLCGTYELLPFRNLNGQLSRRSTDIHFKRYIADDEEQSQYFINALGTFQMHLPLRDIPDLVTDWDYFYERSLGCIGILKDWLTRSLSLALREGKETLTRQHIEKRAHSVTQCAEILSEIARGEEELLESEEQRLLLRESMNLDVFIPTENPAPTGIMETDKKPIKRHKSPAGRRNPVRDKIGMDAA